MLATAERRTATPRRWSAAEDSLLRNLVARLGDRRGRHSKWKDIAQNFQGRNEKDCRKRWFHSLDPTLRKGKWTKEEDVELLRSFTTLGPKWSEIALRIPGRKDDQCSKRYYEILAPNVQNRLQPWSPAEDEHLVSQIALLGKTWSQIAAKMPNRTALTCRNRWRTLSRGSRQISTIRSPTATSVASDSAVQSLHSAPTSSEGFTDLSASDFSDAERTSPRTDRTRIDPDMVPFPLIYPDFDASLLDVDDLTSLEPDKSASQAFDASLESEFPRAAAASAHVGTALANTQALNDLNTDIGDYQFPETYTSSRWPVPTELSGNLDILALQPVSPARSEISAGDFTSTYHLPDTFGGTELNGFDQIPFLWSADPTQSLRTIHETASGASGMNTLSTWGMQLPREITSTTHPFDSSQAQKPNPMQIVHVVHHYHHHINHYRSNPTSSASVS